MHTLINESKLPLRRACDSPGLSAATAYPNVATYRRALQRASGLASALAGSAARGDFGRHAQRTVLRPNAHANLSFVAR